MDDGSSAVAVVLRAQAHASGAGLTDISDAGGWRAYRAGSGRPGPAARGEA
jgi:hypothetical protein